MGINCDPILHSKLDPELILSNINRLFTGMLIRGSDIGQIKEKIRQRIQNNQVANIEGWKNFVNEEIYNSEFSQTTRALVSAAMQDAQANYNDATLPLLCLLFLSSSEQNTFLNGFKAINLIRRAKEVGSNVQNVYNMMPNNYSNFSAQGLYNFASGVNNAFHNVGGAFNQASNPSMIRINDLKNLMNYYINFLTLLPVNLLAQYKEGGPMQGYVITVLNNAFNKGVQSNFVNNKLFMGYEGQNEVNVDQFFNQHYNTLRNDNQLRKDFVTSYVQSLSPKDIIKLIAKK